MLANDHTQDPVRDINDGIKSPGQEGQEGSGEGVMDGRRESRRVQRMGKSTFVVSLPHQWVSSAGLQPHDTLFFTFEEDGSLRLSIDALRFEPVSRARCTINAGKCTGKGALRRLIAACYVAGRDTITIARPCSDDKQEMWDAVRFLTGLTVVEEDAAKVVLQCFLEAGKYSLPAVLQRVQSINSQLFDHFVRTLTDGAADPSEVERLHGESNRVFCLAQRQIRRALGRPGEYREMGLKSPQQLPGYGLLTQYQNVVADILAGMVVSALALGEHRDKETVMLLRQTVELARSVWECFGTAMEAFESASIEKANGALAIAGKVRDANDRERALYRGQPGGLQATPEFLAIYTGMVRILAIGGFVANAAVVRAVDGPVTEKNASYISPI